MARYSIFMLGGFDCRRGDQSLGLRLPKKAIGLLAYLAARPGQPCSREALGRLLWTQSGREQARHSVRQALLSMRHALAEAECSTLLVCDGDTLALDRSDVEVDVVELDRLLDDGSIAALEQAGPLYRGELLEGMRLGEAGFDEWASAERARVRERAREGLGVLLRDQQRTGAIEAGIQTALRLLRLDRTQERVHRTLIRLYSRQGRRAEALRQYRTCVAMLRGELGVHPAPETVRLYREILQPRAPVHRVATEV